MGRTKAAPVDRVLALTKAVLKAVGRPPRCRREQLPTRLAEDGVTFDPAELDEVLARLEDVGHLVRVQRNSGYPLFLVLDGRRPYDDTDALAADVCSSLKRRGEQFENDEELRSYLDEDKVDYTPESLAVALRQLEAVGPDASHPGRPVRP